MKSSHDMRVIPAASNKANSVWVMAAGYVKRNHVESPGGELFGIIA